MFPKGFVKMQGSYNELVQSNKDFIEMLDNLNHEAQKKEEETRKMSEKSTRRMSVMRRVSGLSTSSSMMVRWLLFLHLNKEI